MNRVLITNDDGIDAGGINALASLAERLFEEVWVIAPQNQASQIGHRVTTDTPIDFEERGKRRIAVNGTPADCIRVGLHLLDARPDWVWSGINHGGNLGRHDYYISGTLAAAREAAFFKIPALGASHYMKRGLDLNWDSAILRVERAFQQIQKEKTDPGVFWSINLPHLDNDESEPDIVFCELEKEPLDVDFHFDEEKKHLIYRGTYHGRSREKGSDVDICFGGDVSVSRMEI
jgi:5'-nucleotidase